MQLACASMRRELVICGHPRYKHTDFCQWSVPPDPMRRTVEALTGPSFDRVIYGGEGCLSWLNSTSETEGRTFRIPTVSENVLYCAMRAAGVQPSGTVDTRIDAT